MGNSSSHNIHHIQQPATATLQPASTFQRDPRKQLPPGCKVLPERIPGQKLRITDNGNVLQNGGTISGRKVCNGPPPPTVEDQELLRVLRRRSDIVEEFEPTREDSPDIIGKTNSVQYSNSKIGIPERPPSSAAVEPPYTETQGGKLVRKKSPKKSKAPVPPYLEQQPKDLSFDKSSQKSFVEARKAFSNFLRPNHKKENHDPVKRLSKDSTGVVYSNTRHEFQQTPPSEIGSRTGYTTYYPVPTPQPSQPPPIKAALQPQPQHIELPVQAPPTNKSNQGYGYTNSGISSSKPNLVEYRPPLKPDADLKYELMKRVKSMDSLTNSNDRIQSNGYLRNHKELNKSIDSLHVLANQERNNSSSSRRDRDEVGRRASTASDSLFRRNSASSNERAKLLEKVERWPMAPVVPGDRKHEEIHSDLGQWHHRDNSHQNVRLARRESLGNPQQQQHHYFYGHGDPTHGSLDRRASAERLAGSGHRAKDVLPGHERPRNDTNTPRRVKQKQLEEFADSRRREFGRREAALHSVQITGVDDIINDGDASEDEMDINMQLRPTLPKRILAIPRFSPTQVWRSLHVDDIDVIPSLDGDKLPPIAPVSHSRRRRNSDRSSDEDGDREADVFEDRIQRVARPVAPPRGSQEKSADSGISRDAGSPLPVMYDFDAVMHQSDRAYLSRQPVPVMASTPTSNDKKGAWTPEEDLASDFDAGSVEGGGGGSHQWSGGKEMVTAQPKLITRRDMFAPRVPRSERASECDSERRQLSGGVAEKARKVKGAAAAAAAVEGTSASPGNPQTFHSVRRLKRSLSGVLGNGPLRSKTEDVTNIDENWSLSRSLPNSLHNGQEGDKLLSIPNQSKPPLAVQHQQMHQQNTNNIRNSSISMIPKYTSAFPIKGLSRSESGPIHPMHHNEVNGNPNEDFAVHRRPFADLEGLAYTNERLNSRGMENGNNYAAWWYSPRGGHIVYLPEYDAKQIVAEQQANAVGVGVGTGTNAIPIDTAGKKPKKFSYQSTVRQNERKHLEQKLNQEVAIKEKQREREVRMVNKVEEEFQKKRDREKANIRQQLRILSMESSQNGDMGFYSDGGQNSRNYNDGSQLMNWSREFPVYDDSDQVYRCEDGGSRSLPPIAILPREYETASRNPRGTKCENGGGGGFFSGIGKWMRRQQRLEKTQDRQTSRQEPEGAPSYNGNGHGGPYGDAEMMDGSFHQNNPRYSSGRMTDSWDGRVDPNAKYYRNPNGGVGGHYANTTMGELGRAKPGQRHSIAVDGRGSHPYNGDGPLPLRNNNVNVTSSSDGGWQSEVDNRKDLHKSLERGSEYRGRYLHEKPTLGIHQRSQSFSEIWDDDSARRKIGKMPNPVIQPYNGNKPSYRPVPFGANSFGGPN